MYRALPWRAAHLDSPPARPDAGAPSIVRWRLGGGGERQRGGHRLLDLHELALRLVEPRDELADERIELVDQALLVRKLDVEIEPALGIRGVEIVGHGATISASRRSHHRAPAVAQRLER